MHVTVFGMGKRKMHVTVHCNRDNCQVRSYGRNSLGLAVGSRTDLCGTYNTITFNEYSTWSRKMTIFVSRHYPRKSYVMDIGAFSYNARSSEVGHTPPGALCITNRVLCHLNHVVCNFL